MNITSSTFDFNSELKTNFRQIKNTLKRLDRFIFFLEKKFIRSVYVTKFYYTRNCRIGFIRFYKKIV
jgi:hypothetical protein